MWWRQEAAGARCIAFQTFPSERRYVAKPFWATTLKRLSKLGMSFLGDSRLPYTHKCPNLNLWRLCIASPVRVLFHFVWECWMICFRFRWSFGGATAWKTTHMQFCLNLSSWQKLSRWQFCHSMLELLCMYAETLSQSFPLLPSNPSSLANSLWNTLLKRSISPFAWGVIDRATVVFNISVCKECLKLSWKRIVSHCRLQVQADFPHDWIQQIGTLQTVAESNIRCKCNLWPFTVVDNECHSKATSLRSVIQGPNYINSQFFPSHCWK